jgi:hypothetical protein
MDIKKGEERQANGIESIFNKITSENILNLKNREGHSDTRSVQTHARPLVHSQNTKPMSHGFR